jgi:ubiquinone/menaquinone biosynthesis C-methylase UbiE
MWDAEQKLSHIKKYLNKSDKILDIGSGPGSVYMLLKKKGFNVVPVDVQDLSFTNEAKPIIYNGEKLPFKNGNFDVALILTVLHHTPYPERIVLEAMRVAKRIIVIEDVYYNKIQKYLTYFLDSFLNLEFLGHPHSNKDDNGWQALFRRLGLKLNGMQHKRFILLCKQTIFYLEK